MRQLKSINLPCYFAMFSLCDPMTSENAVKKIKWQKFMDDEIVIVKKNNTRKLTKLLKG
jgi:hypothetical protein